jgi:GntR family transcriptional repressor for pyruvate dehydrogenase complex
LEFEAIRKNTAPEMVVQQILKRISAGELSAGSRLPPQRDLAQNFGVGRSTIREALNALAVMGYLEAQQGRGTFIAKDLPEDDPSVVKLKTAFRAASLLDILELRETLECRAAELAAERIEAGQLKKLKKSLQDMKKGLDEYSSFLKADMEFHTVVAEATANGIYSEMIGFLLQRVVKHHKRFKTNLLSMEYRAHSIRTFQQILGCLEGEDGRGAAKWMRDHLNAIRQELKDIL